MFLPSFLSIFKICSAVAALATVQQPDKTALQPWKIFPLKQVIYPRSIYVKYQPYWVIQAGCGPFAAIDATGNHSKGLPGTGTPDEGCNQHDFPDNLQMYSRYWPVPGYDGRFALLFATYQPKIVLDADADREDLRNHRHHWHHYALFFHRMTKDPLPYACAFHKQDGTITAMPWKWCLQNTVNQRPVVLVTNDGLKVGNYVHVPNDKVRGTFNLAAWELLHVEEIANFNKQNWLPAVCLMQTDNLQSAMAAFEAATQKYKHL